MKKYRPSELLFTQDSINPYFSHETKIHDEINHIKSLWSWNRSAAMEKYLPLEIGTCHNDGKLYCNDNRRLYMFRVLEREGYVSEINVVKRGLRPKSPDVGCHITFRGGEKPYPHCSCGSSCSLM